MFPKIDFWKQLFVDFLTNYLKPFNCIRTFSKFDVFHLKKNLFSTNFLSISGHFGTTFFSLPNLFLPLQAIWSSFDFFLNYWPKFIFGPLFWGCFKNYFWWIVLSFQTIWSNFIFFNFWRSSNPAWKLVEKWCLILPPPF